MQSIVSVFNVQLYFGIFLASLMTVLGVWIYEFLNHQFPKSVNMLQGLSAGMLLAVIFLGILPEATEIVQKTFPQGQILIAIASIAIGVLVLPAFEKMLPVKHHHDFEDSHHHSQKSVVYIILGAFGIHSLFELLAILVTGSSNPILGWTLVMIIAIHNIPIGFIIHAQLKAFGLQAKQVALMVFSLISIQCLMAVIIYAVLLPLVTESLTGILLGMTTGIMLYLTFDELLPQISKVENQHVVNACVIAGLLGMYGIIAVTGH